MHNLHRTEFSSLYLYHYCRKFNTIFFVLQNEDIFLPHPNLPQEGKLLEDLYEELSVKIRPKDNPTTQPLLLGHVIQEQSHNNQFHVSHKTSQQLLAKLKAKVETSP